MRFHVLAVSFVIGWSFCFGLILGAAELSTQDLSQTKSAELMRLLLKDKSRLAALRELCKRNDMKRYEKRHSPEIVVCPQSKEHAPLYLILTRDKFEINDDDDELPEEQQTASKSHSLVKRNEIDVFTSEGQVIYKFDRNDMNYSVIADINGDGLIEHIRHTNYGIKDVSLVQVFEVFAGPAEAFEEFADPEKSKVKPLLYRARVKLPMFFIVAKAQI